MRTRSAVMAAIAAGVAALGSGSGADAGEAVLDVELSNLRNLAQFGRVGAYPEGTLGLAFETTAHNLGDVEVDWIAAMDPRHPFIGQNLYRYRDGRLEQIALAWLKHGWLSTNWGCGDTPPGDFLGLGCSDTYSSGNNSNRFWLGPRSEVNPLTGAWEPCGSNFDTGGGVSAPDCARSSETYATDVAHRLRVSEQDLLLAEGVLEIEGFYIVAGDQDVFNNFRWRGVGNQYQGSNSWSFPNATPQTPGPIIFSWGDEQVYFEPRTEGDAVAAVRVVSLGGGAYRYEYNVFNMNVDREFGSFAAPVHESVNLSSFGFHAPPEPEETQYATTAWAPLYGGGALTWSAPAPAGPGESHPNTLRYGTMYSFWFVADAPPVAGAVTLTQHLAGAEGPLTAALLVPEAPVVVGDLNGDGMVDGVDLAFLLGAWGSGPGPADLNDDGDVDGVDLALLLGNWG